MLAREVSMFSSGPVLLQGFSSLKMHFCESGYRNVNSSCRFSRFSFENLGQTLDPSNRTDTSEGMGVGLTGCYHFRRLWILTGGSFRIPRVKSQEMTLMGKTLMRLLYRQWNYLLCSFSQTRPSWDDFFFFFVNKERFHDCLDLTVRKVAWLLILEEMQLSFAE